MCACACVCACVCVCTYVHVCLHECVYDNWSGIQGKIKNGYNVIKMLNKMCILTEAETFTVNGRLYNINPMKVFSIVHL